MKRILLLLACASSLAAAEVTSEARACYDWFATLGFPDVKDARWAEVWQGSWWSSGSDSKPQARTLHGFIVNETGDEFTVVSPDLTVRALRKSKTGIPPHERVGYEERPFAEMVGKQLEALRNPPKDGFRRFGAHLGQKAEVFALSFFCWRRGDNDLSAQLYAEAEKLPGYHQREEKRAIDMQQELEIELGHAAMWDAVLRVGGGSLAGDTWGGDGKLQPRVELLKAFRRIVRLFPRCDHVERAKSTIAMLERMIAEDENHKQLTQQQIDQLPLEQRIAELIWLLRDQNGHQMSQPGWCDIFGYRDDNTTAAHQLLKIGYPSAPALIEALTDDRHSRSVGFHRDFHFSHTILTVGDCAQQILNRMTGQNFYSPGSTSGYMSNEDQMIAVQKSARAWWDEYQKKGLKQMLVDNISAGKTAPDSLVAQLKVADPAAVEAAVLAGAANASDEWLTRRFIEHLDKLNTPKSTEALLKLMNTNSNLMVRLDAAVSLLNHDHADALPAILREWMSYHSTKESFDDPFNALTDILASHGSDRAVLALVSEWDQRLPGQRLKIVEQIGTCMGAKPRDFSFHSRAKPRPSSPQAKERVIELLVHALDDTETQYGISGGRSDLPYGEASIGDFALCALHEIDGARFAFSPKAGRRQRDAERINAANIWRKEHAQPLMPPPPPPGPKLLPAQALKIVRVSIEPPQGSEVAELTKKAKNFEGTDFAPGTLSELLTWFVQFHPSSVSGLVIEASRENDLTGVELHLRARLSPSKADENPSWGHGYGGRCGNQEIGSSSGGSSENFLLKADFWHNFEERVGVVLKQPPETEFRFHAGAHRQ